MRLLLINPNTSVHITERLCASARAALAQGDCLHCVTASSGPDVVRSAAQLAQADANAMALAREHASGHDAIVLGISLDGASVRLREQHPGLAVVGMTEAALFAADRLATRIGLLTLGAPLLPLYRERVAQLGLAASVVAYEAPEAPLAFAAGAARVAPAMLDVLAPACARLRDAGAQALVLAGAVLCGYAEVLEARCGVPVFDGIAAAVSHCRRQTT